MNNRDYIDNIENLTPEQLEYFERMRGKGVPFERIRRITGYLVGDMKRWNPGKQAEEHDRVFHASVSFAKALAD